MTQYLLSVYIDESAEPPSEELLEQLYKDVDAVNQKMKDAGAWVFGGGLHATNAATVVRAKEGEVLTTDGPYVESKEQLGGFWIIECADLDAALKWAEQATVACQAPIEVRPFQDDAG
jgi:hypothetical protein